MVRLASRSGRRVGALALAVLAAGSLSACRTIEDSRGGSDEPEQEQRQPEPTRAAAAEPAAPTSIPSGAAPAGEAAGSGGPAGSGDSEAPNGAAGSGDDAGAAGAAGSGDDAGSTGAVGSDATASPSTPSAADAEARERAVEADAAAAAAARDEAAAARAAREPGEGAVLGTTASSKPVDPWRLVGQPYLVDDEAPAASPDGLTTFTLWFRTRGEFRGVRQGTSVTDDRHYKVGLVSVPELPGYVPGGVGMTQRLDGMVRKGRYCYTAEVHVKAQRGSRRFAIRRAGAPLQVEFDLRGAPVQRRTATVVVRSTVSEDPPVTPVEKALGCR